VFENPYAADTGETVFVPLRLGDDARRFPATHGYPTIAAVERRLNAPADRIRLIAGAWVPRSAGEIPAFADHTSGWGRILPPGDKFFCVQPLSNHFVLSRDELEQLVGLAGRVDFVEPSQTLDGEPCLVAGGGVIQRACGLALLWSADLLSRRTDLRACLDQLDRMPDAVRAGVHVIEAPAVCSDVWRAGLSELARRVVSDDRARFGVYLPQAVDLAPLLGALDAVSGAREKLKMQWLSGGAGGPVSAGLAPGITCDCSLDIEGADPYVTDRPYLPLAFDARVPTFAVGGGGLFAVPRFDGGALPARSSRIWDRVTMSPERTAEQALRRLVSEPVDRAHDRLRAALDLPRRQVYLRELEVNRRAVDRWHDYHVYNWPPPPAVVHRLVSYDAATLTARGSALRALQDLQPGAPVMTGDAFISTAETVARRALSDAAAIRDQQVTAHEYLAAGGRAALSADSERLIDRLPRSLGSTLEIGFGYGLTAQRVAARATRYVGIDLQTEQGRALRAAGGIGLVADIHALPLKSASFDTVIADNVLEHASAPLDALRELRRVMRSGGRAYVLIPLDAVTSQYQIRTHLWKADERSVRRAAEWTGLDVVELQVLEYASLEVYGCFPASGGRTCLVVLQRPVGDSTCEADRAQSGVPCVES
jgi:SAM-dependent methyltransferase